MKKAPSGYSLHIGVGKFNTEVLPAPPKDVKSACNNAIAMTTLFAELPLKKKNIAVLLNERATHQNILTELERIASLAEAGDLVCVTFSGHGGQREDLDSREDDGLDETWTCYDDRLVDDELCRIWSLCKQGVLIWFISDSCHSGTMFKGEDEQTPTQCEVQTEAEPQNITRFTECESGEEVKASLISISAVDCDQEAQDGVYLSKFTSAFLETWDRGKFQGTYKEFHRKLIQHQNFSLDKWPIIHGFAPNTTEESLLNQIMFNF